MFHRIVKWMNELDHVCDVARLDDRMLADIGIARGRIGNAVRGEPEREAVKPRAADYGAGWADRARRAPGVCAAIPAVATRREPTR